MDDGFQRQLQQQALEASVKAVQQKIASLVCPTHQENPELKFSEDSGPGEQKMSFHCCCDTLAGMLQEALRS
jgi:hypothetical protein